MLDERRMVADIWKLMIYDLRAIESTMKLCNLNLNGMIGINVLEAVSLLLSYYEVYVRASIGRHPTTRILIASRDLRSAI